jgi:hypothetical protein
MYFDPANYDEELSPRFEPELDATDIVIGCRVLM